jgi:hypothetical protein
MGRIIRISESNLVKVIKKVITEDEQETVITSLLKSMLGSPTSKSTSSSTNKEIDTKTDSSSSGKSSNISTDFNNMVDRIIDNFEGGYYDPETMKSSAMGESGETMYGMDAKASDMLKTSGGQKFWDLIHEDKKENPSCWKLEYDPAKGSGKCYNPTLARKLKDLIASIMKPEFDRLANLYLTPESKEIVESDPGLLFNFTYCVWNGAGYFKKFSTVLNKKVEYGIRNPKELSKIMIDYRKNFSEYSSFANNLTQRGGRQMEKALGMA